MPDAVALGEARRTTVGCNAVGDGAIVSVAALVMEVGLAAVVAVDLGELERDSEQPATIMAQMSSPAMLCVSLRDTARLSGQAARHIVGGRCS